MDNSLRHIYILSLSLKKKEKTFSLLLKKFQTGGLGWASVVIGHLGEPLVTMGLLHSYQDLEALTSPEDARKSRLQN